MRWLTLWIRTMLGAHHWPHITQPDPAMEEIRARQRRVLAEIEALEREALSWRRREP